MLIGLHYNNPLEDAEWAELAGLIIPYLDFERPDPLPSGEYLKPIPFQKERTRVVRPETLDQYNELLSKYKSNDMRNLLIIVNTHYNLLDAEDSASFRYYEQAFDRLGGTIWGDAPTKFKDSPITYQGDPTDVTKLGRMAFYGAQRGKEAYSLTTRYFGRYITTPHTLLVGMAVTFPYRSKVHNQLLNLLPSEDNWWHGAAQIKNEVPSRVQKTIQRLYDMGVTVASVTEKSHVRLEEYGIPHAQVPLPDYKYQYNPKYARQYGHIIRDSVDSSMPAVEGASVNTTQEGLTLKDYSGWTYSG